MQNKGRINKISKIVPLGDRVLVDPGDTDTEEGHKKTASGILVPENINKEKPEQGTVVAVGEGNYENGKLVPLKVKVGDKVIFSKYGYDEIKMNDKKYFIIKEDNILAIIK